MRLIDLDIEWSAQYAPDLAATREEPGAALAARRLDRLAGYLGATGAAVLVARAGEGGRGLADQLARYEAEFAGRLLYGPDDVARWRDDPEGMTWGVLAVAGAVPAAELGPLFDRGVRIFRPGPQDLEASTLETLLSLAPGSGQAGPRPGLDLADLTVAAAAMALDWFGADVSRPERVVPLWSQGAAGNRGDATDELLRRLRALGGNIGLGVGSPWHEDAEGLKQAVERLSEWPLADRPGIEGLALATAFPARERMATGLESAEAILAWANAEFDPATAAQLVEGNGRRLLERLAGA